MAGATRGDIMAPSSKGTMAQIFDSVGGGEELVASSPKRKTGRSRATGHDAAALATGRPYFPFESFATWLEMKILQRWKPEWSPAALESLDTRGVMARDSLPSARPCISPCAPRLT